MFFYIIIGITNVIILASMMYVYGRAATVQEHRILDVTFTDEQLEDEDIGLIAEHFKKIHGGILLAGFVSQFLLIFLHKYMSLFLLFYIIWMVGIMAADMGWFIRMHREMYELKVRKGYTCGSGQIIRVDTRVSTQENKMAVSGWWFVPVFLSGFLILNVPQARTMFNDLVAVILFLMPFGTKIMFWLIYRYFVKKKNKVYCENEVANYECSRITKYYYSLALVAAAYIDSAAMLMLQYSYMKECNAWTFVMTVFFILELSVCALILIAGMMVRKKRRDVLRESDEKEILADDDYYWAKGWYENPWDNNLFIQDRMNTMHFTLNFAKPAAKIIVAAVTAVFAAASIWLVAMLFLLDFQEMHIEMTQDSIVLEAPMYDRTIPVDEIEEAELLSDLPEDDYIRINGTATDSYLLGHFKDGQGQKCMIYYYRGYQPVLKIVTGKEIYYCSSKDDGTIEEIYNELCRKDD